MSKITIWLDDEHDAVDTLREVTRLVEEGFHSGCNPDFEYEE